MEPRTALVPAVPVKKSVKPNYIICLEDGLKFKSLKRHLGTAYGMTPAQYRHSERLNFLISTTTNLSQRGHTSAN